MVAGIYNINHVQLLLLNPEIAPEMVNGGKLTQINSSHKRYQQLIIQKTPWAIVHFLTTWFVVARRCRMSLVFLYPAGVLVNETGS